MRDPNLIIDRQQELARLHQLLQPGEPQLALMYGRRRVGKTHLLARAWKDVPSFYFTASETTPAQNRAALLDSFATWTDARIHTEDYPTWRAVFRLLLEHDSPNPLVLTIDEFQYLGENAREIKAVASELNAAWEMRRPPRPLVLVIAGSAVRTLQSLSDGGSPCTVGSPGRADSVPSTTGTRASSPATRTLGIGPTPTGSSAVPRATCRPSTPCGPSRTMRFR